MTYKLPPTDSPDFEYRLISDDFGKAVVWRYVKDPAYRSFHDGGYGGSWWSIAGLLIELPPSLRKDPTILNHLCG